MNSYYHNFSGFLNQNNNNNQGQQASGVVLYDQPRQDK